MSLMRLEKGKGKHVNEKMNGYIDPNRREGEMGQIVFVTMETEGLIMITTARWCSHLDESHSVLGSSYSERGSGGKEAKLGFSITI